ncbi:MAG: hypothetical protein J6O18_06445 [Bacilli bacterium]|nr:hypothetical protein [Bacilli bacterium]
MGEGKKIAVSSQKIGFNGAFAFGLFTLLYFFAGIIVMSILLVWRPDSWWVYVIVSTASAAAVTVLGVYLFYKDIWKQKNYLVVEDGRMCWIGKRERYFNIPIDDIHKITFARSTMLNNLTIAYGENWTRHLRMSRTNANKISVWTGIPLQVTGPTFRESLHSGVIQLHRDIIKYRRHIAILVAGAIVTSLGFTFHYVFGLIWLDCLMSFICYLFGALQFAVFYYLSPSFDFGGWKKPLKVFLPLFVMLMIIVVLFGGITAINAAMLKGGFSVNFLFFACYLSSSFILVICAAVLILCIFSYS